jgi:hypothetical protein
MRGCAWVGTTDGQADENPPSYVWQKTINAGCLLYTAHRLKIWPAVEY